jgi:hypothetical protein
MSDLPLGAHTPSSKIDIKENSSAENHKKAGGAKKGPKGFGRSSPAVSEADEVIPIVSQANACEECHCDLHFKNIREHTVIESVPVVAKKVVYRCELHRLFRPQHPCEAAEMTRLTFPL